LNFDQSSQYESCGKYSNLSPCKISHFFEVPIIFPIFILSCYLFSWKKDLNWKNHRAPLSLRSAQLGADPSPSPRVKPAHAICFLGTLPSWPRRLVDPTCQPHSFTGGKPLCTRPTTVPVTAQTHPLPLLRHRPSSPTKFPSMGRPPITTPHHKDDRVSTCHLEPSRRLRCTVASRHRCPPASAPRRAVRQ
jgi:hypothetical protein